MKPLNRKLLLLTSLLTVLPIPAGVALWNRLPDRVPTHFNFQGVPDGWSSKPFAVFGLPLLVLGLYLLCVFAVSMDPKRRNVSGKLFTLVVWICPLVSILCSTMMYLSALGCTFNMTAIMLVLTGLTLVIVGNYLPKCRQNYTVGIKIPWTLSDEDNWNRTHRLAGPVWVAGGAVLILSALTGFARLWLLIGVFLVLTAAPVLYSLWLYLQKKKAQ